MWKDWWSRLTPPQAAQGPIEGEDAFKRAVEDACRREETFLPLFEQLSFALRIAESPVPIDRATIPLHLSLGPDKVKELAAQLKLSPYLKNNIQALVHHFREDQRELKNAQRALELLAGQPELHVRGESIQRLYRLFHFLPASRERFRDYPLFYQLFGGQAGEAPAAIALVPDELKFFLSDGPASACDPAFEAAEETEGHPHDLEALLEMIEVAPICLEVGMDLVPLVDPILGGHLTASIMRLRVQLARELGFVLPGVQFRPAPDGRPNGYRLMVRGAMVAEGEIMIGYQLAIETPEAEAEGAELVGFSTVEPALGRAATWVTRSEGERAAKLGYLVLDNSDVLLSHLDEVARAHAHELLAMEDVSLMIDRVRESAPQTVDAVMPEKLELAEYHLILKNLLKERVSIRDQLTILERLAHVARPVHPFYLADRFGENRASLESIMLMEISAQIRPLNDPTILTEMVRVALSRQICAGLADAHGTLDVVLLAPQVEQVLLEGIATATTGQHLQLSPATSERLVSRLVAECQCLERPVLVCDPRVRPFVRQLTARYLPRLTVLSQAELHPQFRVQPVGTVSLIES